MNDEYDDAINALLASGEVVAVDMPDGGKGYKLTEKGFTAAEELIKRSPGARQMMAKLTAQAALRNAREPEE